MYLSSSWQCGRWSSEVNAVFSVSAGLRPGRRAGSDRSGRCSVRRLLNAGLCRRYKSRTTTQQIRKHIERRTVVLRMQIRMVSKWIRIRIKMVRICSTVEQSRICKTLWSPGIDSKESILSAYVAWRAVTTNRVLVPAGQVT